MSTDGGRRGIDPPPALASVTVAEAYAERVADPDGGC
jgi:hypothetical protein